MAAPKTDPASTDEFDFGAWLTGASAPEREVTVYAANALRADIARLEQERADAKAGGKFRRGLRVFAASGRLP